MKILKSIYMTVIMLPLLVACSATSPTPEGTASVVPKCACGAECKCAQCGMDAGACWCENCKCEKCQKKEAAAAPASEKPKSCSCAHHK
ncbi:MAG: hypothetical protein IT292_11055 [Deltaproteobacteria bacterium]|nr:hypothetical protein [Deltaproteobacteria bacterium]